MKVWKIYGILGLLGLPVLFFNTSIGLGWTVGHCVMSTLALARERFYDILLSNTEFSMAQYAAYIVFTIGLLSVPLGISFFFSEIINPYAIFAAYFIDRSLHFILNLFVKEETHAN